MGRLSLVGTTTIQFPQPFPMRERVCVTQIRCAPLTLARELPIEVAKDEPVILTHVITYFHFANQAATAASRADPAISTPRAAVAARARRQLGVQRARFILAAYGM